MTRRRRLRPLWRPRAQGGTKPGSPSGPPLPPEAFTGTGGRRLPQRRHARPPWLRNWRAPAWLVPAIFACVLVGLIIIIIVTG